ncbi:MAG TPA: hypothetical protein VGR65_09895 [Casimicrobiaceae bacterium]|jgi:hypothetical protein|nr:hypothetical protein [Casimicrobiaceae bacterium]
MSTRFFARTGVVSIAVVVIILCGLLGRAPAATAQTQTAVEYYYGGWNFFFVTAFPDEIAALDGGAFGGAWKRTGETFDVWTGPTNGAVPTCRFFSTIFAPKSSHFYTPYAAECAALKAGTGWQFEAIAFYLQLPDANGNCPAGTEVLYRLYNNGMGGAPNHRFTRNAALFNQMRAAGWPFEGDGRTGAFACVPQSAPPASTAEGFWTGTNADLTAIVLDDGTFYLFSSSSSSVDVVLGTAIYTDGQFNSSNAIDINFSALGITNTNATISGTYVPRSSLDGVITSAFGTVTFTSTYDSTYEQPTSLSAAAGTYSGVALTTAGGGNVVITFTAAGAFSGTTIGCSFAGTLTPRGGVNVFNLSITFQGGVCGTSTLTGIAGYDPVSGQLVVIAPNATRTSVFLVSATKQ